MGFWFLFRSDIFFRKKYFNFNSTKIVLTNDF